MAVETRLQHATAEEPIGRSDMGIVVANETTPLVVSKPTTAATDKAIALEETWAILKLAGPLLCAAAVDIVPDVAMGMLMGNVSANDSATILAASSLADSIKVFVVYTVMGGVGSALGTLGTQSFGAQQLAQLCLYAQAAVVVYAYLLPVLTLLSLNGATVLKLLGQDPRLLPVATVFMRLDAVSTPLIFAASVARCVLTSQRIVTPLVYVPLVASAVSLPLAYALGYHTRLGYVGIALAGVVNNGVKAAVLVAAAWKSPACQLDWPGWQWREAHALLARLCPLGIASTLMVLSQSFGLNVMSVLSGYLPNAAVSLASSSIAGSLFTLTTIPLSGVDGGGAILVGNALGANAPRRARIIGAVNLIVATLTGALTALVGMCVAVPFARNSTSDESTAEAAASLFYAIMLVVPLSGWMFGAQGVLRACGKQSVVAALNTLCQLVLGAPLAYTLGMTFGLGNAGLWYGVMIGIFVYNIMATVYLARLDWAKVAQGAHVDTHIHARKASLV